MGEEAPAAAPPRRARRIARIALHVALALAAGEVTVRFVRVDQLARPELLDGNRALLGDLSEITAFFGSEQQAPPPGSLTQIPPATRTFGWYDRPQWDYFDENGCVEYRINALGFRDLEFPREKPAGELRLLALGDSFTFAAGVRVEDCWVQQLEGLLEERRGAPVEVVNAGFARGFRPESYATWLAEQGVLLEPDGVIVGFCLNDVSVDIPMWIPLQPPPRPAPLRSRLLAELRASLGEWWPGGAPEPVPSAPIKARRVVASHPQEWKSAQDGLRSIRDQARARGIGCLVVVFPMNSQLASGYLFEELHALVRDFCAAEGIDCLDLLPVFQGRDERALWVHPTDQHFNAVGQRLKAEAIAQWIATRPEWLRAP